MHVAESVLRALQDSKTNTINTQELIPRVDQLKHLTCCCHDERDLVERPPPCWNEGCKRICSKDDAIFEPTSNQPQ